MVNIFIFTRDFRIIDNYGLHHSLKDNDTIPIFIFTPQQFINNKYKSYHSITFMIDSLIDLDKQIKKHSNSKLYLFLGNYIDVIKDIIKHNDIQNIFINKDFTPFSNKRFNDIKKIFKNTFQIEDYNLLPMETLFNKSNQPYRVFTPFFNNSKKFFKDIPTPKKLNNYPFVKLRKSTKFIINIKDTFKHFDKQNTLLKGGRKYALKQLRLVKNQRNYPKMRDFLTYKTTLLSPYLKFGCISIRETFHQFTKHLQNNNTLITQLLWREFYLYISYYFPHVLQGQISSHNKDFQDRFSNFKWSNDKQIFKKWCNAQTGFPIVDASMTQLNTTGYMHNRARLIVSSFLIKLCLIDWRWGEQYFATKLIDYDPAQNNAGWQFHHGGASNADYFRILSPISQANRFDKNAEFIKQFLPNLKHIPPKHLIDWEKHYTNYDLKQINYFKPIFDYNKQRDKALDTYKKLFK